MPTLRHHLIAFIPMLVPILPSMVVEQWFYNAGAAILFIGIILYGALIMWIHLRRMAGLGYFSSTRSDRVAKRHQRGRARLSPPAMASTAGIPLLARHSVSIAVEVRSVTRLAYMDRSGASGTRIGATGVINVAV